MFLPTNTTLFSTSTTRPAVSPTETAPEPTTIQNATQTTTASVWTVDDDKLGVCFTVYGLFAAMLFFFTAIVAVDMARKWRTGNIRETLRGLRSLLITVVTLPCLIFSKANCVGLGVRFVDLFRKDENKRRTVKKPPPPSLDQGFEHQKIINRLSSRKPLPPPTKVTVKTPKPTGETDLEAGKTTNVTVTEIAVPIENGVEATQVPAIIVTPASVISEAGSEGGSTKENKAESKEDTNEGSNEDTKATAPPPACTPSNDVDSDSDSTSKSDIDSMYEGLCPGCFPGIDFRRSARDGNAQHTASAEEGGAEEAIAEEGSAEEGAKEGETL